MSQTTSHTTSRRAVCLARVPPGDTGTGGALGVYGNVASLAEAGFTVQAISLGAPENLDHCPFPVHFLGSHPPQSEEIRNRLRQLLETIQPDVVWLHHLILWQAFEALRNYYPHVLLSGEADWEIALRRSELRAPEKDLWHRSVRAFRLKRHLKEMQVLERATFKQADKRGVVAAWCGADATKMSQRTGVHVHSCVLSFPDWGLRSVPPDKQQSRALLLGYLATTATRHGLRYFFERVWPLWQKCPPRSELRVVGGGKLPETDQFREPPESPLLNWVGYVPCLENEWNQAIAMLVPVPVQTGLRTRIAEAWCRGVPVIAHPSAEGGLPMMRRGENYLAAEQPHEWIECMRLLESNPEISAHLIAAGRRTYERELSIGAAAERYGRLTESAIRKFQQTAA